MTRILLGCLLALSVGFVTGCGGGGTETTVIESTQSAEEAAAEAEAYEAEMEAEDVGGEDE